MTRTKEHFTERYYNGKRNFPYSIGIWWRRVTGNIPVSDTPTYSYDVLEVINPQPRSRGIVAYSLWGDANSQRFKTELLENLLSNRQTQEKIIVDFMRIGHWHEYQVYGRGRIIITESLTGEDSYSNTKGYDSHAGQTLNFYVQTDKRPNCFYKSFPIYIE